MTEPTPKPETGGELQNRVFIAVSTNSSNEITTDKIMSLIAAHTRRAVLLGRLEELADIETRGNYSGYVDVYKGKLAITVRDRIKALEAELKEMQ